MKRFAWMTILLLSTIASGAKKIEGEYIVPVDDRVLARHSRFPVDITVDDVKKPTSFEFRLPKELVGDDVLISVKLVDGKWKGDMLSKLTQYKKAEADKLMKWQISFSKLPMSKKEANAYCIMHSSYDDSLAYAKVRTYFGNEAGGTIQWKME